MGDNHGTARQGSACFGAVRRQGAVDSRIVKKFGKSGSGRPFCDRHNVSSLYLHERVAIPVTVRRRRRFDIAGAGVRMAAPGPSYGFTGVEVAGAPVSVHASVPSCCVEVIEWPAQSGQEYSLSDCSTYR